MSQTVKTTSLIGEHFVCYFLECKNFKLFNCPHTGRCILKTYLCNGENECGDWNDEENCGEP